MGTVESIESAFETLYSEYYLSIFRYLSSKGVAIQDSEDLANECFMYCYQHWNDYDPNKATRKTWLYLVVRSRWKNYLRDKKQLYSLDDFENLLPGKDELDQAVRLQAIRDELARLLEQLPEKQREAIVLRFFRQWSDEEIAGWLNTSRTNVRVMIHRALKRMNDESSDFLRTVLE